MLKNEDIFKKIYQENKSKVRALIFNMTGSYALDDLEQEVFIKVWNNLTLFSGKASISTWIYRICYNTSIDFIRKNKFKLIESQSSDLTENQDLVQNTLLKIEEDSRIILIMFYFDGLSVKDIARMLEIKEGTVKSRLFKARKLLEKELEGKMNE